MPVRRRCLELPAACTGDAVDDAVLIDQNIALWAESIIQAAAAESVKDGFFPRAPGTVANPGGRTQIEDRSTAARTSAVSSTIGGASTEHAVRVHGIFRQLWQHRYAIGGFINALGDMATSLVIDANDREAFGPLAQQLTP
jgi:hypothetical protein